MSNSPSNNKKSNADVDWYAIACKIRNQNNELKEEQAQLKNLINEQQQQLKLYLSQNQEQRTKQPKLESQISQYQEQIEQKNEQIDNLQTNIGHLTQELAKIQGQIALLERECSLLQEDCNEEKNKLKKVEVENKDLRVRLQRQQRYNLQYKTALDKFLDTSTPNNRDSNDSLGIISWSGNKTEEIVNTNQSNLDDNWNDDSDDDSSIIITENNSSKSKDGKNIKNKAQSHSQEQIKEATRSQNEQQTTSKHQDENKNNKNNGHRRFINLPSFGLGKRNEE